MLMTLGADIDIVFSSSRGNSKEEDNQNPTTWAGKHDEYSMADSDMKENKSNLSQEPLRITMTHGCILILPEVHLEVS